MTRSNLFAWLVQEPPIHGSGHGSLLGPRKERGGRVSSVFIFIYTRDYPKNGDGKPWKKGDEPLSPYEIYVEPQNHLTPYQRIRQCHWYKADMDSQEQVVEVLLRRYLHEDEVKYYLRQLTLMARKHDGNADI